MVVSDTVCVRNARHLVGVVVGACIGSPLAFYVRFSNEATYSLDMNELERFCRSCRRPKDEHDEHTGKCLFGAGVWT